MCGAQYRGDVGVLRPVLQELCGIKVRNTMGGVWAVLLIDSVDSTTWMEYVTIDDVRAHSRAAIGDNFLNKRTRAYG